MPDLAGPGEFLAGDRLLKADRNLAVALDGVYRRGEIYLRALQKVSSVAFGTPWGRFLTRYVALPFGAAFVLIEGLQHVSALFLPKAVERRVAPAESRFVPGGRGAALRPHPFAGLPGRGLGGRPGDRQGDPRGGRRGAVVAHGPAARSAGSSRAGHSRPPGGGGPVRWSPRRPFGWPWARPGSRDPGGMSGARRPSWARGCCSIRASGRTWRNCSPTRSSTAGTTSATTSCRGSIGRSWRRPPESWRRSSGCSTRWTNGCGSGSGKAGSPWGRRPSSGSAGSSSCTRSGSPSPSWSSRRSTRSSTSRW